MRARDPWMTNVHEPSATSLISWIGRDIRLLTKGANDSALRRLTAPCSGGSSSTTVKTSALVGDAVSIPKKDPLQPSDTAQTSIVTAPFIELIAALVRSADATCSVFGKCRSKDSLQYFGSKSCIDGRLCQPCSSEEARDTCAMETTGIHNKANAKATPKYLSLRMKSSSVRHVDGRRPQLFKHRFRSRHDRFSDIFQRHE